MKYLVLNSARLNTEVANSVNEDKLFFHKGKYLYFINVKLPPYFLYHYSFSMKGMIKQIHNKPSIK